MIKKLEDEHIGPASGDGFLSANTMMSFAGALWAFFGLTLFTILKDVVLGEQTSSVDSRVSEWVLRVVVGFFAVNFVCIAVTQTIGLCRMEPSAGRHVGFLRILNLFVLGCYIFIAVCAWTGAREAFSAGNPN